MSDYYDPNRIRNRYDKLGEEEWNRLDSTPKGKISFQTHMKFIEKYVKPDDLILEAGAGSGRFTIELLKIGVKVTVLDLSPEQLEVNRKKVQELNLDGNVLQRIQGDICDLSQFDDGQFDSVICYR
jgi:ubiquinone/menaquinone biosynthesis C-methylase UbiE